MNAGKLVAFEVLASPSASNPSGIPADLAQKGMLDYPGTKRLLHMPHGWCDRLILVNPTGALHGKNLPFHAGIINRSLFSLLLSIAPFCRTYEVIHGVKPIAYLGQLKPFWDDFWKAKLARGLFEKTVMECVQYLMDARGPVCDIVMDGLGCFNEDDPDWIAAWILRQRGFKVACNARGENTPAMWLGFDGYSEVAVARTTTNRVWTLNTGRQTVMVTNDDFAVSELAIHREQGRDIAIAASGWGDDGSLPQLWLDIIHHEAA